jgi:hypothetical protein
MFGWVTSAETAFRYFKQTQTWMSGKKINDNNPNELSLLDINIARSYEILGWEGVGNRQLLCFFKP